ncbi:MAG: oxidoreductase [Prochloraceae cyanobacterium]|nr:oxidoreductase [Prochloraceae cyanobacterium]
MKKIRFATIWVAGCAGCHMSFLDTDEWLFDLAQYVDVVYSPALVDRKEYPENVDVCVVEGAIGNEEHLEFIHQVRKNTKLLISLGDCAVTSNVSGLRNKYGSAEPVLKRTYWELADLNPQSPYDDEGILPKLLDRVMPVHEVVPVDLFIPGCPPEAERIKAAIEPLLNNKLPVMEGREMIKFG